jgi:hypothetical protein
MRRAGSLAAIALLAAVIVLAQEKSSEPKPPKTDLPYLLQASRLIPTEPQPVTRSGSKTDDTISVPGATSTARTPLPEPIFLFSPGEIKASDFELIRFQVAGGRRQWKKGQQTSSDDEPDQPLRLTLRPMAEGVVRIEAAVMLNPGEYALIPHGKNTAFCFTVF